MGSGRMTADDWGAYSTTHFVDRTVDKIYTSSTIDSRFDPKKITMRESCDSDDNPESTAAIIALDVTGSMSYVLEATAKNLGVLVQEVYDRKPITDPHMMFMGIGDAEMRDEYPLQVTQFEADIRIAEQLKNIYFERHGGGNSYESYALAWYFAALRTKIDCFEKRGKKGTLFTIGDEGPTPYLKADDIEYTLGERPQKDFTDKELLEMVSRQYDVFHLIVEEGDFASRHGGEVIKKWTELLGQRAIPISDCTKVAEVIVSVLQANAGEDKDKIISSWDGDTSVVVSKAINGLTKSDGVASSSDGVVEL